MTRTSKRFALIAVLATLVVGVPGASAKTVSYTAKLSTTTQSTANGYPFPGGKAELRGRVETNPFGPGTLVDHVRIMTASGSSKFWFIGTETVSFADGTQRDRFIGVATVNSDGSQDLVIKGHFVGGTGRYEGASGHYTFKGRAEPGSTVVNGASSGKVTF